MAESGLFGPHPLTQAGVDAAVKGVGPGAYALGNVDAQGVFRIHYVGRSDTDVNGRLNTHVPKAYTHFKYAFYSTPKDAYLKECRLYHDFSPPDNEIHPAAPEGTYASCPVCGA